MTGALPSSQDSARVFVFGGRAPDDLTWNAVFEPGTLEDFAADTWLAPGGDRALEPCSEATDARSRPSNSERTPEDSIAEGF